MKNNFILLLKYLPGQPDFSPSYLFSNMGERYTTELEDRSSKHSRLVYFDYVQVIITNTSVYEERNDICGDINYVS